MAYQLHGRTRVGIVHAPAMGLVATYAEGGGASVNVNGARAAVSGTRSLADAVISVVLTSTCRSPVSCRVTAGRSLLHCWSARNLPAFGGEVQCDATC